MVEWSCRICSCSMTEVSICEFMSRIELRGSVLSIYTVLQLLAYISHYKLTWCAPKSNSSSHWYIHKFHVCMLNAPCIYNSICIVIIIKCTFVVIFIGQPLLGLPLYCLLSLILTGSRGLGSAASVGSPWPGYELKCRISMLAHFQNLYISL